MHPGNIVAEQAARREIEKEAENHIALGLLLRKERQEPKRSAVQKVLASDLSVPQKIEKIRELDEMEAGQDVGLVVRQAAAQAVRRRIFKLTQTVKEVPKPVPFFSYLFREYSRIREFGRRTRVLEAGVWPPGVRADPEIRGFFVAKLQLWAIALAPRLTLVAEQGWLHLTPAHYNHVMLLRRLVERIQGFDFVHLDLHDRGVIEKLRRIESLFLMLHYRPETLGIIEGSLRLIHDKLRAGDQEEEEAVSLSIRILSPEGSIPSLHNCLVGLNILKSRRFLTLSDLTRKGLGEMVSVRDFDCEPAVRLRIDDFIQNAVDGVRRLHDQVHEARRLNSYISRDPDGNLDAGELRTLYNAGDGREKHDFSLDQENLVRFTFRLLRCFDRAFGSLLNGQVMLEGDEKAAVFSRAFFQVELSRLRTVMEKLEKGPFSFSAYPLSRYLAIKGAELGPIGTEMEARQLIDEGVADLVDLGKTVARVLSQKRPGMAKGKPEPLEQVILQGKPFSLPHEDRRIHASGFIRGKTVAEALASAVTTCFTAGLLMQDQFLFLFLGREKKAESEMRARLQQLETLLDPESFREMQTLYS
jgi:hypothetical protein